MPSKKIEICIRCNELKRYQAHGLCKNCYDVIREDWRKDRTEYMKEWGERYYQKNKLIIAKKRKQQYQEYNKHIRIPREKFAYYNFNSVRSTRIYRKHGYWVYYPSRKAVHVAIVEKILGRNLKKGECVHHIDGNGFNNHHKNLIVCEYPFHMWIHRQARAGA